MSRMTEDQAYEALAAAVRALHAHGATMTSLVEAVEDTYISAEGEDPELAECPTCSGMGEDRYGMPCRSCQPRPVYPAPAWAEQYES